MSYRSSFNSLSHSDIVHTDYRKALEELILFEKSKYAIQYNYSPINNVLYCVSQLNTNPIVPSKNTFEIRLSRECEGYTDFLIESKSDITYEIGLYQIYPDQKSRIKIDIDSETLIFPEAAIYCQFYLKISFLDKIDNLKISFNGIFLRDRNFRKDFNIDDIFYDISKLIAYDSKMFETKWKKEVSNKYKTIKKLLKSDKRLYNDIINLIILF